MSRLTKISLLVLGIVFTVAVVMTVLVKTLVTPKLVQDSLVPLIENSLQRKVTVDRIKISLFSGISVQDLQIRQKSSPNNFFTVASLDLHYRFLPLLAGKVIIDQVKLVRPQLVVIRHSDGSFNIDDLLGKKKKPNQEAKKEIQAPTSGNEAQTQTKTGTSTGVLSLLVNHAAISGGHVLFVDQWHTGQEPKRYSIDKLAIVANHIVSDKPFPVKLDGLLNGAKVDLSGTVNLMSRSGLFDLRLDQLDLTKFMPLFQKVLPGKLGSGRLAANIRGKVTPNQIEVKGKLALDRLDLVLNALPKATMHQAKLELDFSSLSYPLSYQWKKKLLNFSGLVMKFNNIRLRAAGKVAFNSPHPNLAMALFLDHLNLERLDQGLPAGLADYIRPYNLTGQVNALVEIAGKTDSGLQLLRKADLRLEDVQADLSGLQTLVNGNLDFDGHRIKAEKLLVDFDDQPTRLSIHAANLFGQKITGNFQLTADSFDFNKLQRKTQKDTTQAATDTASQDDTGNNDGQQSPPAGLQSQAPQAATSPGNIGPFAIPATIKGTIAIDQVIYRQLVLDHLLTDIQLKNNHLQITHASCGVAGGKLDALADIDLGLKGLAYQGTLNLNQIQMSVLDGGLFPDSSQSITGKMTSKNTYSGHGTHIDSLLRALQINGEINIKNGQITGSPLVAALVTYLGKPNLSQLSFDSLQAHYTMQNGVVSLLGGMESSMLRLKPKGTIGVDGAMNVSLNARLSPQTMASLGTDNDLSQIMTDENGWGLLPLKFAGSLNAPRIALDSRALESQVVGKARQTLKQQLLQRIGPSDQNQSDQQTGQLIDTTLNKIFGN